MKLKPIIRNRETNNYYDYAVSYGLNPHDGRTFQSPQSFAGMGRFYNDVANDIIIHDGEYLLIKCRHEYFIYLPSEVDPIPDDAYSYIKTYEAIREF